MRFPRATLFLLLAAACATPARIVTTADDKVKTVAQAADALASVDVVVLGEQHDSTAVHRTHLALLQQLHARRPDLVVAMEMFERDVQNVLLQYLGGLIDEATFLAQSRPWDNYARDYRPVIEFAREHGVVVLAANAPKELAAKAGKQGVQSVLGSPHVARTTSAPEDEYWDAFVDTMKAHVGTQGDGAMQRMYAAQCLKDDTMAESILDYLAARQKVGSTPLVVLIAGQFHTDHRRGVVARLQGRNQALRIGLVSAEAVDDLDAGLYTAPRTIADYVVVVGKQESPVGSVPPLPKEHPPVPAAPTAAPAEPAAPAAPAEGDAEGLRPALGLQLDYASGGMVVQTVREGGPAAAAGLEAGDVILELAGHPVADVNEYTEVLNTLKIGRKVAVKIRRGNIEAALQVLVGSRPR